MPASSSAAKPESENRCNLDPDGDAVSEDRRRSELAGVPSVEPAGHPGP
jgi:hypothetical protein